MSLHPHHTPKLQSLLLCLVTYTFTQTPTPFFHLSLYPLSGLRFIKGHYIHQGAGVIVDSILFSFLFFFSFFIPPPNSNFPFLLSASSCLLLELQSKFQNKKTKKANKVLMLFLCVFSTETEPSRTYC